MDDFSALLLKLEGLGIKPGALQTIPTPVSKVKVQPIEELIPGQFEKTLFGDVFTVTTQYPFPYQHGRLPLNPPSTFLNVWKWAKCNSIEPPSMKNIVFLDTETSGLSGGTGTLVFMIGLGEFNAAGFTVTQIFLRDPTEEQAMLAVLARLTAKYTTVVSYNGKSFDIPMLRSRHVQNRFPFEMDNWNHIDILHLVRQVWRYSMDSRTLKEMEVNVLNFNRSQEEVPGWMVPQLYFEYLQTRNALPLTGVFYHNAIDIVSLAALFVASNQLLENPFESGAIPTSEADLIALARIFENIANPSIAAHLYARGIASGLPDSLELPSILRYAELCKRNMQFSDAVLLWEKAIEKNSIEACIELAKYYEHHTNELDSACEFTETALGLLPDIPLYSVNQMKMDLQKRLERISKKMVKQNNRMYGNSHAES